MLRWLALVLCVSCVESSVEICPDGAACPSGTTCVQVTRADTSTHDYCAKPEQLGECMADGDACAGTTGTCHGGACIATACGNLLLDVGEACDDGNIAALDGCAADCASNEQCGNGVIDTTTHEECDNGPDHLDHDGCTSTCKQEALSWRNIQFPFHSAATATYDATRGRVVLFGGESLADNSSSSDTWEWDGTRWELLESVERPASRRYARVAYDAERKETVLFGGEFEPTATWVLDRTGWHVRTPVGDTPVGREWSVMAYDPVGKRVVLFGGYKPSTGPKDDTWAWDGTTWTFLGMGNPAASVQMAMAFDPTRNALVLVNEAGVHELVGTTWSDRFSAGYPELVNMPELAFDPLSGNMMLIGWGLAAGDKSVWMLQGTTWTQVASLPGTTVDSAATTDPVRRRVVVHSSDGTYEWNGTSWDTRARAAPAGAHPGSAYATDRRRHEVLQFGGRDVNATYDDTWWWNGAWAEYTGSEPPPRDRTTLCYDEARDGILMVGGADINSNSIAETWLWQNHAWVAQTAGTQPPARFSAGLAYDGEHKRIVMFGGQNFYLQPNLRNDTWTWDGTWHAEAPVGMPARRTAPAMGYDPIRKRVVMFGGANPTGVAWSDTWEWDGTDWTWVMMTPSPPGRRGGSLEWDASQRALVLAGGTPGANDRPATEIWMYDGSWRLQPTEADPPPVGPIIASPDGTGVASVLLDKVLRLRWTSNAPDEACSDIDIDGDGLAGCADPDCFDRCSPLCPPMTTCPAGSPGCGDGSCDTSLESSVLCPADCP